MESFNFLRAGNPVSAKNNWNVYCPYGWRSWPRGNFEIWNYVE